MAEHLDPGPSGKELAFEELLHEVNCILSFSERRETEVLTHFSKEATIATGKNSNIKRAGKNRSFSQKDIRLSSIRYRLRFLSSKLYAGEIPIEVIGEIKSLEHIHADEAIELFILAPASFFLLQNQYCDPLLFYKRADGRYQLICQWGSPIPWYRFVLRYPYRDFKSLVISALLFGLIVAVFCGLAGFCNDPNLMKSILYKVPIVILSSGIFSTLALCYGLVTYTDFSEDNWNSAYFN
jgi:hypothetical protein